MKPKHILSIFIAAVLLAAVTYTLTSTESAEAYIEKIEGERERQFKFIRFNVESPLNDSQKLAFKKLNFYSIDPFYRVKAKMIPVENKKVRLVPLTDGSKEKYIEHSYVEFSFDGANSNRLLLLQALSESDKRNFFLAFTDETSAKETYGGGRYINARQDGKNSITLDFNLAYNPYCAYNPGFACPIPPKENRLEISIPAGEKNYEE